MRQNPGALAIPGFSAGPRNLEPAFGRPSARHPDGSSDRCWNRPAGADQPIHTHIYAASSGPAVELAPVAAPPCGAPAGWRSCGPTRQTTFTCEHVGQAPSLSHTFLFRTDSVLVHRRVRLAVSGCLDALRTIQSLSLGFFRRGLSSATSQRFFRGNRHSAARKARPGRATPRWRSLSAS